MNLKQLEAFVQVAEKKSFSKAAKTLFLTQPTVSAHISGLEKELNTRLLIRNTKDVELSKEGERLYEYAKQIVLMTEQIIQDFGREPDINEQSSIDIAASTVPAQYLLPEILAKFRQKYPKEQFHIQESDSADVVEQVALRNVDIGFTGTELPNKYCEFVPFYEDDLIVITPNTEQFHKRKHGGSVLDWIRSEPLIMREEGSGTRKETMKILQNMGISLNELNIIASVENPETIKRSVGNGMGISILSALAARDAVSNGAVLGFSLGCQTCDKTARGTDLSCQTYDKNVQWTLFSETLGKRQIYVVYNKSFHLSPGAERVLKIMKKMYPQMKI